MMKEYTDIAKEQKMPLEIANVAVELFSKLFTQLEDTNSGIKRCNIKQAIIATCFYYACRNSGHPRETKEVCKIFKITGKVLTKGLNIFEDLMDPSYKNLDLIDPISFIPRFTGNLGMSHDQQEQVEDFVRQAVNHPDLCDSTPSHLVAGCILELCSRNEWKHQKKQIAQACEVSTVILQRMHGRITDVLSGN